MYAVAAKGEAISLEEKRNGCSVPCRRLYMSYDAEGCCWCLFVVLSYSILVCFCTWYYLPVLAYFIVLYVVVCGRDYRLCCAAALHLATILRQRTSLLCYDTIPQ